MKFVNYFTAKYLALLLQVFSHKISQLAAKECLFRDTEGTKNNFVKIMDGTINKKQTFVLNRVLT